MAEIGGLLQFSNEIHLFTSVAFQHSLTSITNDNYFSESKARHYGVMLTLGLKKSV
ncbi:hypothetical protein LVD15_26015 [Fulvivirga maritima]|uniref:hypothetical protein n=1 Tax=Fulvivirga maritima TaxID=2904247 RepID=UPI001F33590B|nr:hypothetical protein [Fulvivirga maritima]UII26710.1 hypothetical protein LVD15_26015 [Fulvivirga maritima]